MKNIIKNRFKVQDEKTPKANLYLLKRTVMISLGSLLLFAVDGYAQNKIGAAIPVVATENHVGLSVKNLDLEKQWYEKVFGMEEIQHFELPQPKVRTVLLRSPNGLGMELIEREGAIRKKDYKDALDAASDLGYGHWAIVVSDLKQAYQQLINAGAVSVSVPGPAVQPGASFAYVKDPEGNLIEVMQLPKQ
jgi:catechol 2,3-dioxygenase-like lactoylglutathione lyase family enzyme